ncbi:hypothetical protein [Paenibacillus sp. KN14-4R]|uniref:hypothetical protein n=1 Tax=Paenibacillus sp. KN14-4R TaxID=3445773 RepID=UPI003FA1812C
MPTITDALRVRGIGASGGVSPTDKQALIDIVNAAEANNDAIKVDVITKLKALNPSLTLTNASTWTEIRAAIASMQNRGAVTITPGTADQAIIDGYYTGAGKVLGDPDLIAGNIKAGVNIFGVNGKPEVVDTTTAVGAAAGDILNGKEAFVNGVKRVGMITNNGVVDQTITTQGGQVALSGYVAPGSKVTAQLTNVTPENIKKGVSAGGVVGTLEYLGPGDSIVWSQNGSDGIQTGTSMAMVYRIKCSLGLTYRVRYSFRSTFSTGYVYAQIYVNGRAKGVSRSFYGFNNPHIHAEDIQVNAGDTIEIWGYGEQYSGSLADFSLGITSMNFTRV